MKGYARSTSPMYSPRSGGFNHEAATNRWAQASQAGWLLCSSEHILDECTTLLARRTNYAWASDWGKDALASGIEWLQATSPEWTAALSLMRKYADQGVSFTDCLSFVMMKRAGLKEVLGFDRHFEAASFRVLL